MSARGNIRETERTLMRCARRAKADGIDLVSDAFEERNGNGVCVLGAYEAYHRNARLALPDGDALTPAWDAIEVGFDAGPRKGHPIRWWHLGRRLRKRLNPRRARS